VVREYDLLLLGERSRQDPAGAALARPAFEALDALARGALTGVLTSTRQGAVPALKLGSHVGVLRTPDGTVIEVLPKTHERGDDAGPAGRCCCGCSRPPTCASRSRRPRT